MITLENSEPPFIQGLRVAKNLLLNLKEKKLKENVPPQPTPPQSEQLKPKLQQSKLEASPQKHQKQEIGVREALEEKLNEIGRELYECNLENETYQTVFDSMNEYYQQHYKFIEQNEKLKRTGYSLKEKIDEFKQKIEANLKQSQQYRMQQSQLRELTAEQLKAYLVAENNRAEQNLLPSFPISLPKATLSSFQEKEQQECESELKLRWQWLSKQVARKPPANRKQTFEQDQIRRTNYSEAYGV